MERVKRNIVTIRILLAAILMLLTNCKRDERDNPWDRFAIITPDAWAPKAVQISNIDITKHEVAWTYEGDNRIEGFRIDRKEGDSEWEVGVHTAEKDSRSWIDTNVIPDTTLTYTYKVYAIAGDNKSSNIFASIDVEFPAPTSIDIEKLSDVSYKLTWADNSIGEQGFKIDRRTDGDWQIAHGIVEANQTAFVDTNVFVSKSVLPVEYRVYAFYNVHNSGSLGISTKASINPPSNLEINHTSIASATLSWENNSASAKGFRVERRYEDRDWEILSTVKETNFIDNDFNLNDLIYYRVCTIIGEYSSDFIENNFDATIPPPTNAALEQISDISYKLTWNDNAVGEHGYKIDRRIDNGSWQLEYGTVDADDTSFIDENVFSNKNSINIEYRVYAYYNTFESAKIYATTNAALTPPTNLEINQNSITSAIISWTDNSTGEDGFKIERSYGIGNWSLLETTTTNTYTDNDFSLNATVHYRVFAYANTYSSSSIESNFISTIPAPSNFDVSVSSPTSIVLSWEFNHTGHQGFYIDRKVNDDAWQVAFATLQPQDLSYTDNSVSFSENSSYTYRIYSFVNESNSSSIELAVARPSVVTANVSSIEGYSATSGGEVISDGGSPITARGVCWSTETNPTLSDNHTTNGSGIGIYTSNITGLDLSTTYYVRAYATSNAGTVYGETESFTTLGLPQVTTAEVIDITGTTAKSGGNVVSDGGSPVSQRGVVWGTSELPTIDNCLGFTNDGSGTGQWTSIINNLETSTNYYLRAYTSNKLGTNYGSQILFTTLDKSKAVDIDGNIYNSVVIGDFLWLSENLKVTRYLNGDPIRTGLDASDWTNTTEGAFAIYPHSEIEGLYTESEVVEAYGILYNWYTTVDPRGLCPDGWRVPSDDEWSQMLSHIENLNSIDVGNQLKSCLQINSPFGGLCDTNNHPRWSDYNVCQNYGTNNFGFNGLPSGYRFSSSIATFDYIGNRAIWWTSTSGSEDAAYMRMLIDNDSNVKRVNSPKTYGYSIRCIKNLE